MLKKALLVFFSCAVLLLTAAILAPFSYTFMLNMGLLPETVNITGTGSMYPTFPKGTGESDIVNFKEIVAWPKMQRYPSGFQFLGVDFFTYDFQHGDIVEFENEKTKVITKEKYGEEASFVKRVIALPGDRIELRDGFVYLNGTPLEESYTAKPRSSYGGDFLPDCKPLIVPKGQVLVLGDNRKASLDSRYGLGFVSYSDIHYVLPFASQEEYRKLWRDTTNDLSLAHTATVDNDEFVKLVNEKRAEKKKKPLKYNALLSNSSKIRSLAMIKSNDFSTEATRSGMTLKKAVKEAGYQNIVFAEVYTRGYYEAEELIDNFLEFPQTQKIFYSSDYQDIGLSAVLGEIDNCPVQVVTVHFGGYVPPNYTAAEIESWQKMVNALDEYLPFWENLRSVDGVNKELLEKLINAISRRRENGKRILSQMKANQWLTDEELKLIEEDPVLSKEAEKLISELTKQ